MQSLKNIFYFESQAEVLKPALQVHTHDLVTNNDSKAMSSQPSK